MVREMKKKLDRVTEYIELTFYITLLNLILVNIKHNGKFLVINTIKGSKMVSNEEISIRLAAKRKGIDPEKAVESREPFNCEGYLICDKCGGYYELQPGECPGDFTDKCECGGHLRYVHNLNDADELQKTCPNCGSLISDNDLECPICGFELKSLVKEKYFIFGTLWYVNSIFYFLAGFVVTSFVLLILVVPIILKYPQEGITMLVGGSLAPLFFLGGILVSIKRFKLGYLGGYLEWYKKMKWNWNAICIAFMVTLVIGIFGGKFLPVDITFIGPLLGGFIAGYIVDKNYINGITYGGLTVGITGFIGSILLFLLNGSGVTTYAINTGLTASAILIMVVLFSLIEFFIVFFIIGSIGGIIAIFIRKKTK